MLRSARLFLLTGLVTLALQPACGGDDPRPAAPPWTAGETLGGLDLGRDTSSEAIGRLLDPLVAQHVTTVVVTSPASHYLPEAEVELEARLMERTADEAHRRGLKVVWTVPSLKVISPDGIDTKISIANEHPDWLSIPAEPVEEDSPDEVAFLCPEGGYRAQLFTRTARFADTGIDGLFMDAPKMPPPRGAAPFLCAEYQAKFKRETGLDVPTRVDCLGEDALNAACFTVWSDPAFRRFVRHRHDELAGLQTALVGSVRDRNGGNFQIWFRDTEIDTNDATETGNDASFVPATASLARLWDVPGLSGNEGMRRATPRDWVNRLLMAKLARGIDRRTGARTFMTSPGDRDWDAQAVMGIVLAEQGSPFEVRTPFETVGVGADYRTRVYGWARAHEADLYGGAPLARVAVLHVPAARDYVDYGAGLGLYSSTDAPTNLIGGGAPKPDATFWTKALDASVDELEVVGEQRGIGRLLVRRHVPFVIESLEKVTAADLAGYAVVFAPSAAALSDAQIATLKAYVEGGGRLVSTGLGLGAMDQLGAARPAAPFDLGTPAQESVAEKPLGKGTLVHAQALIGRRHLRYDDPFSTAFVDNQLHAAGVDSIAPTASPDVHVEPWSSGDTMTVHLVSFAGLDGSGNTPTEETTVPLALSVPRAVTKVTLSSPDEGAVDADVPFTPEASDPSRVSLTVKVRRHAMLKLTLGGGPLTPKPAAVTPTITKMADSEGYAGHSLAFEGQGFGDKPGKVRFGDAACTVTLWSPTRVAAYLPSDTLPATKDVVVEVGGTALPGKPFTVKAPAKLPTKPMLDGLAFVKDKLRSAWGGVFTNYVDRVDTPGATEVYPYGHHQTAEHLGLMLWVTAGMLDHDAFEQAYGFLDKRMLSPRRDLVNWAVDKTAGTPMLQKDEASALPLDGNAPLDDFRVVRGLYSGWLQWKDERYLNAAIRAGDALYRTSVGRSEDLVVEYPDGLVAYAYNWPENAGLGKTDDEVIPIDYADLFTMKWLSQRDPRWNKVIASNVSLMERAAMANGQFYNSYLPATKELSGDFEYRDTVAATKVKTIQSLWIAIHLARVGRKDKAQKALDFYKAQYTAKGRVPEYLNYDGTDVTATELPEALANGEARIYAQLVRLALYLGDTTFADKVVTEKLLPDQVVFVGSPLYGSFGQDSAADGDAEAWNTLETLLALLLQQGSPVLTQTYPSP